MGKRDFAREHRRQSTHDAGGKGKWEERRQGQTYHVFSSCSFLGAYLVSVVNALTSALLSAFVAVEVDQPSKLEDISWTKPRICMDFSI